MSALQTLLGACPRQAIVPRVGSIARALLLTALLVGAGVPGTADAGDNVGGGWLSPSQNNWPLIPVHAVLTPDGRVLSYGTKADGTQTGYFIYDIWDPAQGLSNGHITLDNMTLTDIFCSSQVIMPQSGSIFLAGGDNWTGTSTTNTGNNNTNVFRYTDDSLTRGNNMNRARWYSTSTVLPNGEIYIQGGSGGTDRPEVRQLDGTFRLLTGADTGTLNIPAFFPRNFVAPDGRVFGFGSDGRMYWVNPTGNGTITHAAWFSGGSYGGWTGSAAMYRPGKILNISGNTNGAIVIDITSGTPVVTPTGSMSAQRQWVNATIIADGRVVATGGSPVDNDATNASLSAAIWNPSTGQWTIGPNGSRARLYHSGALLLPDASVMVMGGGAPGPLNNRHAEIYYPPYLYTSSGAWASRPSITSAPDSIDVGQNFTMTASGTIQRVTMIKTGSVTHSFNMDQRFLELPFSSSSGTLFVQMTNLAGEAPPGYYLLFAINNQGVPSVAKIVRVNIQGSSQVPVDYTPSIGGTGGSAYTLACNSSETLVGLYGNSAGTYVNRVGLQCIQIDQNGRWIGDPVNRGAAGAQTGTAFTRTCARDSAISGFRGRSANYVDQLDFQCRALTSAGKVSGSVAYLGAVGGAGGASRGPFSCDTNNPVYSITGKAGTWIDSFGMLCRQAPITQVSTNSPPVVTNPGAQSTAAGATVSLQISASDPDLDTLNYTAGGLPAGLGISSASGVISGTPTTTGTSSVTVNVSDGQATTSVTFDWTISAANPLVLDPMPDQPPRQVNTAITYTASSSNGINTQYKWYFDDGSESGWSSSPSVTHTYTQPTIYWLSVTARDDRGIEQTQNFTQLIHRPLTAQAPANSRNLAIGSGKLWVVNQDNDTVSVFNVSNNQKLAETAVGTAPRSVAIAPNGEVWVTNKLSSSISVLNASTHAVARTISLPRGSQPFGLVFAPDGSAAFVALEGTGRVARLDPVSGSVLVSADVGSSPRHVSINAASSKIYVSRFVTRPLPGEDTATVSTGAQYGGEVAVFNAGSMAQTATVVLRHSDDLDFENSGAGVPNYLGAATISPDGTAAWVPSKKDNIKRGTLRSGGNLNFQNTVRSISSRIDLASDSEAFGARVDHDNASMASAAAFDRYGVFLFVALETSREVAVIDANNSVEFFRINVGRAPQGLAVSADGYRLYVANFMDRTVGVYDLTNLIDKGQWNVPLIATLQAVASEKLSATVLKGKQFFYDARDTRLAREGYMSCASCHNDGGGDGRTWDLTGLGEGLRNTIGLTGRAGAQGFLHWTGNFDEVQDFEGQIRSLAGGTGLMTDAQFNQGTRSQPLGDGKAGVSADLDALAAYVASLNAFPVSPWRNADGTLTSEGAAGKTLFQSLNCTQCHGGANFTESGSATLRDVGTIRQPGSGKRLWGTLTGLDTPTLRGVWATGPYLHDGRAGTLEDAVRAHSGVSISDQDLAKLVAYLKQIDGQESLSSLSPPTFTSQDIGWVGPAGSLAISGGIYTVKGSGADIYGTKDKFHFASQSLTGDGEIVARMLSQTYSKDWAKAGLMFRESLTEGSRHASVLLTPGHGDRFTYRLTTGGNSAETASGNVANWVPRWLRLVRAGNTITGYQSADGSSWVLVGSATFANLAPTLYVGLAVTAYERLFLSTVEFDNVGIGSSSTPPPVNQAPTANFTASPTSGTAPLAVAFNGSASSDPDGTIAGYAWSFGDGGTATGAAANRTYQSPGTYAATLTVTDNAGATNTKSQTIQVSAAVDTTPPSVPGNLRTTSIGTTQVGLAWDASTDPAPGTGVAQYEVTIAGRTPVTSPSPSYTATGLTPNTAYSATVLAIDGNNNRSAASSALPFTTAAQTPTVNFLDRDIGWVGPAGSTSSVNGVYTVSGSGADIFYAKDKFHYTYATLSGNGEIVARVVSQTYPNNGAKAGLMIREALTDGSRHVSMLLMPTAGDKFTWRPTTGGNSSEIGGNAANTVPRWLRLVRSGDVVTGYQSGNGTSWVQVGTTTLTGLPTQVFIGLAVTSGDRLVLSAVEYSDVAITPQP